MRNVECYMCMTLLVVISELAVCEIHGEEIDQNHKVGECEDISSSRLAALIAGANKLKLGDSREEIIVLLGVPTKEENEISKMEGKIIGKSLKYYVRTCSGGVESNFLQLIIDSYNKLRVIDPKGIDGIKPQIEYSDVR